MFLSQPTELITAQILFLDLDSLIELSRVSSITNSICNDDWFWKEKLSFDYPKFPATSSFKEAYILLNRRSVRSILEKDRVDVYGYLLNPSTTDLERRIIEAVRARALKILRLLLSFDMRGADNRYKYCTGLYLATDMGDTELLKVFGESGLEIPDRFLRTTAISGKIDALLYLLTRFEDGSRLLIELLASTYIHSPDRRWEMKRVVKWLEKNGLVSPEDEANVAFILNSQPRLIATDAILSDDLVEYIFNFGDLSMIHILQEKGY